MIRRVLKIMRWGLRGWVLLALAGFIPACSQRRPDAPAHRPWTLRQTRLNVPFFSDRSDQCGPATLASVLKFWGADVRPIHLKKEIYTAGLQGSLTIDLLLAARARGMRAEIVNGSLSWVKDELDAGHPVIAFVNYGFRDLPVGHFLVLTGYDDARQGLYAHSGAKENTLLSYKRFAANWEKTERWTLLILPPTS